MTRRIHRAILNAIPPASRAEVPSGVIPLNAPEGHHISVAHNQEPTPATESPADPTSHRDRPGSLIHSPLIDEALAQVTGVLVATLGVSRTDARELVAVYAVARAVQGGADSGRLRDHILTILAEQKP